MIDSARKHGTLLEAIQILIDLDLSIRKAYISSDGKWFMGVFHVTDLDGNKITNERLINYIEKSLGKIQFVGSKSIEGLTTLELTGTDRVGLLSEIFAVLSDLQINVVESKVWTHNGRIASLIYVKDCDSGFQIQDRFKIERIEERLRIVLKGNNDIRSVKTLVSSEVTHTERRLHQMMFADRDYERKPIIRTNWDVTIVLIQNCLERGYSGINVLCKDRARLLFDVVCTLTDMDYVVFHATLNTTGDRANMINMLLACGGLSKNALYIQEHADIIGYPIVLPRESESVLLGAAILGSVAAKKYSSLSEAMKALNAAGQVIHPSTDPRVKKYHDGKYRIFRELYQQQLSHRAIMAEALS